ncbi:MAG: glycosyltransferase family 4 protein [Oscillochloridaceae bacterium umkhey_bin13]
MTVLFLTGEYPPDPGGVGAYTRCLTEALRAQGAAAAVLTMRTGQLVLLRGDDLQGEVCAPTHRNLDWSPRCWSALIKVLHDVRPSWLHIQYQTGAYAMQPGINLLPWRLRGLAERPRMAVTFHDLLVPYLFPKAGPLRRWVNRRLASDCDAVVATNRADQNGLRQLAPRGPTPHLIPIGSNIAPTPPPGYERRAWRLDQGVAPNELLVAYFGLLATSKGVDVLVEALAQLERPWRLVLIGGAATAPEDRAYAAQVQARISALGLQARLIIPGHLPDDLVSAHLLAADCVALPFRDGASFRRGSLLAALAHGCPVVTTTPADPTDATVLEPATLLVPPGDPLRLAAALTELAANPTQRHHLGQAGMRLAAAYTWPAIATSHRQMYQG